MKAAAFCCSNTCRTDSSVWNNWNQNSSFTIFLFAKRWLKIIINKRDFLSFQENSGKMLRLCFRYQRIPMLHSPTSPLNQTRKLPHQVCVCTTEVSHHLKWGKWKKDHINSQHGRHINVESNHIDALVSLNSAEDTECTYHPSNRKRNKKAWYGHTKIMSLELDILLAYKNKI